MIISRLLTFHFRRAAHHLRPLLARPKEAKKCQSLKGRSLSAGLDWPLEQEVKASGNQTKGTTLSS